MDKITISGSEIELRKRRTNIIMLVGLLVGMVVIGGVFGYRKYRPNRPQPVVQSPELTAALPTASSQPTSNEPRSKDFGLAIDKISANAPIIKEVDPNIDSVYYKALEQGVAHWKGTPYPDQKGNLFIFGHSSFYATAKGDYKDIFAPLDKLDKGDRFDIWYNNAKYTYEVVENKVVSDTDFSVVDGPTPQDKDDKTITIMTCWPPKTIAKRRVVFGKQV